MLKFSIVGIFLALASGCDTGEEPAVAPDLRAELEIGLTQNGEGFFPAEHGVEQLLEYGAQGGMHLLTMPRFRGVSGVVYLERSARLVEDGTLVLRSPTTVIDIPENPDDTWWHRPFAITNFMCPTPVGIKLYDREVEFHYELRATDDTLLATDTLIIMPLCPEGEDQAFCQDVCSGN